MDRTANLKSEETYLKEQELRGKKDSLKQKGRAIKTRTQKNGCWTKEIEIKIINREVNDSSLYL